MLRSLLARLGLRHAEPDQLELQLGADAPRESARATSRTTSRTAPPPPAPTAAPASPVEAGDRLLARLRGHGLRGIETLRLTHNRGTMVSFRGRAMRVHAGFADAPEEVLRALALFVSGRGAERRAARRIILQYPLPRHPAPVRRREQLHPDDITLAERLTLEHRRLNAAHFAGTLRPVAVRVSRRMKTRLGHFAPGGAAPGDIVISRRHIRRHGWREAFETLLHEMVHQWQEESGLPLDHGPAFRRKAREVGVTPSARRVLR